VVCRGTALHERMTDSRSRQPSKVTETSEADGDRSWYRQRTRPAADGWPNEHWTRQIDTHQNVTTRRAPAPTRSSLQYGHQSQTRTTRKHPDVTLTPHTEFHRSHGIRPHQSHVESSNPRIHQHQHWVYAEIYRDVESADTHINTTMAYYKKATLCVSTTPKQY